MLLRYVGYHSYARTMDDCTLKSLEVKPGKLLPSFKKGVTEYNLTVGSQVDSVTFDCEPSDRGASFSISVGYNTYFSVLRNFSKRPV